MKTQEKEPLTLQDYVTLLGGIGLVVVGVIVFMLVFTSLLGLII